MNSQQTRPTPSLPLPRRGPSGVARPVVGPHSPLCGDSRVSLPLIYQLKMVEAASCRVVSVTRLAGVQEAAAALRLLGPTSLQPVLVSGAMIEFLPRGL